jgi:twitching motility protein PilT
MTGRARDMVLDPDQTDRLREVIAEGAYYGMQTFDQALLGHYKAGRVAMEDALRVASSPHDFKLLVAGDGRTATSMDDLGDTAARPQGSPRPAPSAPPSDGAAAPPERSFDSGPAAPRPAGSMAPPGMAA